ncbi:MAG: hypothetical protein O3B43_00230 [Chloroflexi bacterium]|nr:hypothetical protein [Chloroflexota bacterium]
MGKPWFRGAIVVGFMLLLVTSASAAAGWSSGRAEYGATATLEAQIYMLEQYNFALTDIENGQYELARQRLEFIFAADPDFLDVADKWVEVMLVLSQTSVPTGFAPATPSPTPTEDPRPKEGLMVVALNHLAASEWTETIDTLLALRKADSDYLTAKVDGLFYLALRNRGVKNILELGLFEPGLYDFSLAQNFGPLDGQALNYQQWARLYLYGNAFWLAYPQDAAYYYGQLVGLAPDLRDSNGLSAFYRYWQSLVHYADQLAAELNWCEASDQYERAQNARNDNGIQPTADFARQECLALTPQATSTSTSTTSPTINFTPSSTLSATPTPSGSSATPVTPTTGSPSSTPITPSPTPVSSTPTPTLSPTP